VRNHCTIEEQQFFVYQSLCVMPLKLLERVLPWLATSLQEEEAKAMFENIRLAGLIYVPFQYFFFGFVFEL
jgi:zinc finger-like protein